MSWTNCYCSTKLHKYWALFSQINYTVLSSVLFVQEELHIERNGCLLCLVSCYALVSSTAVFCDVTQRFPEEMAAHGGSVVWHTKNGCGGDKLYPSTVTFTFGLSLELSLCFPLMPARFLCRFNFSYSVCSPQTWLPVRAALHTFATMLGSADLCTCSRHFTGFTMLLNCHKVRTLNATQQLLYFNSYSLQCRKFRSSVVFVLIIK